MEMKRDETGYVSINGVTGIQVPDSRTALSILGTNPVVSESKYAKDGWIYVGGKRVRKWYRSMDQTMIWEPILNDLPKLESRYAAVSKLVDKFYHEKYRPMFDKIVEVGQAHAKPTHKYSGGSGAWWAYSAHKYDGVTDSVGFDWLDEEPKEKLHVDIGQAYYRLERQMHRYYGYKAKFRSILNYAIDGLLMDNPPTGNGQILKLIINDRMFWYSATCNRYNVLLWVKLAWAENDIIEMKIN